MTYFRLLPVLHLTTCLLVAAGCDDGDSSAADASADAARPDGPAADATASSDAGQPGADGGDAGVPAGLRPTPYGGLADASKRQVCDWIASQFGGYGKERTCPDGTTVGSLYQSQDECLITLGSCDATVGALETCFSAQAREVCSEDLPAECQDLPQTCI